MSYVSLQARYLLAELAAVGTSLSFYDTEAYLSTAPTYVNEKDIPSHLVDRLNDVVRRFDVSCSKLATFLNLIILYSRISVV